MNLFGMRVHESPFCTLPVPNREHKRRRGQSASYHARVQKKWNKRFGMRRQPAAFVINGDALGMPMLNGLFVHPEYAAVIRNLAAS